MKTYGGPNPSYNPEVLADDLGLLIPVFIGDKWEASKDLRQFVSPILSRYLLGQGIKPVVKEGYPKPLEWVWWEKQRALLAYYCEDAHNTPVFRLFAWNKDGNTKGSAGYGGMYRSTIKRDLGRGYAWITDQYRKRCLYIIKAELRSNGHGHKDRDRIDWGASIPVIKRQGCP